MPAEKTAQREGSYGQNNENYYCVGTSGTRWVKNRTLKDLKIAQLTIREGKVQRKEEIETSEEGKDYAQKLKVA